MRFEDALHAVVKRRAGHDKRSRKLRRGRRIG